MKDVEGRRMGGGKKDGWRVEGWVEGEAPDEELKRFVTLQRSAAL